MTQQVKPIMHFNHDTYSIIKESDRDAFRSFFDPKEHGFKPFSTDTSCWAGFKCQYGIIEDNLFITNVEINEYTEFKPRLFNREPIILENWGNGKNVNYIIKTSIIRLPIPVIYSLPIILLPVVIVPDINLPILITRQFYNLPLTMVH